MNPIENYVFTHEIYRDLEDPKVQELIDEIKFADTIEEAQETWHELQRYSWENPPLIKVGNGATVSAFQNNVEDYNYLDGPILWNTKVKE